MSTSLTSNGKYASISKDGTISQHSVRCENCTALGWTSDSGDWVQAGRNGPACVWVAPSVVEGYLRRLAFDKTYPNQAALHHQIRQTFDLPCDAGCEMPVKNSRHSGIIQQIQEALPTAEVAMRLTRLRGRDVLSGRCPFHGETNGESFKVWTSTQRWKCFGVCGTGGDVIDLIEEADKAGLQWQSTPTS